MSSETTYVFIGGTSEPGGLHVHTATVARAALAQGQACAIVCPSVNFYTSLLADTPIRIDVVAPRAPAEAPLPYWRKVLRPYGRPVPVVVNGKLGETPVADLLALRWLGERIYTIEHRADDVRPDAGWRERLGLRLALRRLIGVSREITDLALSRFALRPDQVALCLNWVDPDFQPADLAARQAAKQALGLTPDQNVVGYHGRMAPEKRVDALLRAYAALPPVLRRAWRLVLMGDGWKRREWAALAGSLGLSDAVRFPGWHPAPAAALAAFDVAVLPSLAEGFPLGLMESMATGCACLAHPMSSTNQLLETGFDRGLLADLGDDTSFASALQGMLEMSDSKRRAMGQAAARYVQVEHSATARIPALLSALDLPAGPVRPDVVKRAALNFEGATP